MTNQNTQKNTYKVTAIAGFIAFALTVGLQVASFDNANKLTSAIDVALGTQIARVVGVDPATQVIKFARVVGVDPMSLHA